MRRLWLTFLALLAWGLAVGRAEVLSDLPKVDPKIEACLKKETVQIDVKRYREIPAQMQRIYDNAFKLNLRQFLLKSNSSKALDTICSMPGLDTMTTWICRTYKAGKWYQEKFRVKAFPKLSVYRTFLEGNLRDGISDCLSKGPAGVAPYYDAYQIVYDEKKYPEKTKLLHEIVHIHVMKTCLKLYSLKQEFERLTNQCVEVPNLLGQSLAKAKNRLLGDGLYYNIKNEALLRRDDDARDWEVKKQRPEAGTYLPKHTRKWDVRLWIGRTLKGLYIIPKTDTVEAGGHRRISLNGRFEAAGRVYERLLNGVEGVTWDDGGCGLRVRGRTVYAPKSVSKASTCRLIARYEEQNQRAQTYMSMKITPSPATRLSIKTVDGSNRLGREGRKGLQAFLLRADGRWEKVNNGVRWRVDPPCAKVQNRTLDASGCCQKSVVTVHATWRGEGKALRASLSLRFKQSVVPVPRLTGQSLSRAKRALKRLGLRLRYRYEKRQQKGRRPNEVLTQTPAPCVWVKKGREVSVTLNPDKAHALIKVPDLTGKKRDEAIRILKRAGLDADDRLYTGPLASSSRELTVVSQQPPAGKEVKAGTTVRFFYTPKRVRVPDVVGLDAQKAQERLAKVKLGYRLIDAPARQANYAVNAVTDQSPSAGTKLFEGSVVQLVINPDYKAQIGMRIEPKKWTYRVGEPVTFIEETLHKKAGNSYRFVWWIDGKKVAEGERFTYRFKQPGDYTVMLDLISSDPTENDTMRRIVEVAESAGGGGVVGGATPEKAGIHITCSPASVKVGETVTCRVRLDNAAGVTQIRWYVADDFVTTGKTLRTSFKEEGVYEIRVGLRKGSNFDEESAWVKVGVGRDAHGIGNRVNRFKSVLEGRKLKVYMSYFIGGLGKWSDWKIVHTISDVQKAWPMITAPQSDGYNTGYLFYVDSYGAMRYRVYGMEFTRYGAKGRLIYSGTVPQSKGVEEMAPVRIYYYGVRFRWQTADRKVCSAYLSKYDPSKSVSVGVSGNVYLKAGLYDLTCKHLPKAADVSRPGGKVGGTKRENHNPSCEVINLPEEAEAGAWYVLWTPGDADGDAVTYRWQIAGASNRTPQGRKVIVQWPKAGRYRLTVTGDDGRGGRCRERVTVRVREKTAQPPATGEGNSATVDVTGGESETQGTGDTQETKGGDKKGGKETTGGAGRDISTNGESGPRGGVALLPGGGGTSNMEYGYDRPGLDYRWFRMKSPDPTICRQTCEKEAQCRAWTYVPPGVQGKRARCWLKNAIPRPVRRKGMVSGVKASHLERGIENASLAEAWFRGWTIASLPMGPDGRVGKILGTDKRFGWYRPAKEVGVAKPPKGAHGAVLYLHPTAKDRPAVLKREIRNGMVKKLSIRVAGHQNGDFRLVVRVDGRKIFSHVVDGKRWHEFDVLVNKKGPFELEVDIEANGWYNEYAFIDTIKLVSHGVCGGSASARYGVRDELASATARWRGCRGQGDRVGRSERPVGDGRPDCVIRLDLYSIRGMITGIEIRNIDGQFSVWDTIPGNGLWLAGVTRLGKRLNRKDGSIRWESMTAQTYLNIHIQDNGSIAKGQTSYKVIVTTEDGRRIITTLPSLKKRAISKPVIPQECYRANRVLWNKDHTKCVVY